MVPLVFRVCVFTLILLLCDGIPADFDQVLIRREHLFPALFLFSCAAVRDEDDGDGNEESQYLMGRQSEHRRSNQRLTAGGEAAVSSAPKVTLSLSASSADEESLGCHVYRLPLLAMPQPIAFGR